jgi:preprotein translocase subunit Sss1
MAEAEPKTDFVVGTVDVTGPKGWVRLLSDAIGKHGFSTVIAFVLVGVIGYLGNLGVEEIKDSFRFNRQKQVESNEKLIKVAEGAIATQAAGNVIIDNNTDTIESIKPVLEDTKRVLERAMTKMDDSN